ncbi:MAG: hypothetical protein SGILL_008005, partial [Bacillariaceae sp.]
HFYIEYAEYRLALVNSPTWGKNPGMLAQAKKQLNYSFYANIVLGICLFLGSSVLINRLTLEMDRRAADIMTGASRLFAGWIFMLLSYNLPQWMGVYFSVVDTYKTKIALMRTTREIRFSFSWTLWKHMATMFFFNLYFSCRRLEFTTLYGFLCESIAVWVAGVGAGIFLIFVVWFTRAKMPNKAKWSAALWAIILGIVSIFCVVIGAIYIEDVMHEDYQEGSYAYGPVNWPALVMSLWIIFVFFVHILSVYIARKHAKNENIDNRYRKSVFQQTLPGVKTKKMDTSGEGSSSKNSDEKDGKEESYKSNPDPMEQAADPENGEDDDSDFGDVQLKTGATTKDFLVDSSEGPSYGYLCRVQLLETYGCCCGCGPCCCKDIKDDNNYHDESRMHEVDVLKQNNTCWRLFDGVKMFLWYCLSAFFVYLTIVNIGATSQQVIVRDNLNNAFEYLYPINYQTGPM